MDDAQMAPPIPFHFDGYKQAEENHLLEIHQPDGVSDALQQIEHGLATILGRYRSLGRLYLYKPLKISQPVYL